MKIFSQLEKAQIENLTSDPTGTGLVAGRMWYRTDTKKFKVYDGTAVQEFVDLSSAQALSSKTLTTPQVNSSAIFEEISTPAAPSAGFRKIYPKSSGWYQQNSAGVETQFSTSPLTTKGDIYTFSTSDTRLPVGSNGQSLVADSGETTGLKWKSPVNCFYTLSSGAAVAYNTLSVMKYATSVYDSNSAYNTSTGEFTVPTGEGGKYRITYRMVTAAVAASSGSAFVAALFKNGSYVRNIGHERAWAAITTNMMILATTTIDLSAGDTISAGYFFSANASGTTLTTNADENWLAIEKVG